MSQITTRRIDDSNPFDPSPATTGGMMEVAGTRAAQEVQAAMVMAKRFPRDEHAAYGRIMQACKRPTLAEQATYSYTKGGTMIEGPSIRMAEVLARSWGNIEFGVVELEQRDGESQMMAYAWDLETCARSIKVFTVVHERHTRNGSKSLTDPRDIYEMTANQGARRLRACILSLIPGDIVDDALAECDKTLAGNNTEPIQDRVRKMLAKFNELDGRITTPIVEKRLGHSISAITEKELVDMRKICRSLIDNMASADKFFDVGSATSSKTADLNATMGLTKETPTTATTQSAKETTAKVDVKPKAEPEPKAEPAKEAEPTDWTKHQLASKYNLADPGKCRIFLRDLALVGNGNLNNATISAGLLAYASAKYPGKNSDALQLEDYITIELAIVDGKFDFKYGTIQR